MKNFGVLKATFAAVGGLLFLGLGIETTVLAPDYAAVYLDNFAKTYIALPCVDEWRARPTTTFDLVQLSTAGEARKRRYVMDDNCRNTGAFSESGRSLTGLLLMRLGMLAPKRQWWDAPYRTEEGLVCPGPANETRRC